MSKKFLFSLVVFFSLLLLSKNVWAAALANPADTSDLTIKVAQEGGYETNVTEVSLSQSIGQVIKIVLGFTGVIFLGLAVYAGILWMTASGNEEKVTTATNILKAAVVGLIIVVSAYSITYFVTKKVGGATTAPAAQQPVGADVIDWGKL